MVRYLISGATGRLGRLVTDLLVQAGEEVHVLARQPQKARELFGDRVKLAEGDFGDPASLDRALYGIDRTLLLSPISEHLVAHQTAFIDAAVRAKVARIVKISGSHWTITAGAGSIAGQAHEAVELHLAAQPIEGVALRPNAWMQVSLPPMIAAIRDARPLYSAYGTAKVGFIDARDIAAVAVNQLRAAKVATEPLVLTGGEALSLSDIATIAGRLVGRTVATTSDRPTGQKPPFDPASFEGRAVGQFMTLIAGGAAAPLTTTVPDLLGRAPRTVETFLAGHLTPGTGATV